MFPELNSVMGMDSGLLEGKFLQVIEGGSDSSFVLHHYLSSYIRQDLPVVLVLFNQSLGHYTSVATKLSVNLTKAIEDGKLHVIQALKELGKHIAVDEERMEGTFIDFSAGKGNSLRSLFFEIKKQYTKLGQSALVIVDDLSILLSLGVPSTDIYFFVRYLQGLTKETGGALLSSLHCMAEDDEACSLSKQLMHLCDMYLKVYGLPTGHCKDVHGVMSITEMNPNVVGTSPSRTMHFKILDKSVSFFALGTSGAVL